MIGTRIDFARGNWDRWWRGNPPRSDQPSGSIKQEVGRIHKSKSANKEIACCTRIFLRRPSCVPQPPLPVTWSITSNVCIRKTLWNFKRDAVHSRLILRHFDKNRRRLDGRFSVSLYFLIVVATGNVSLQSHAEIAGLFQLAISASVVFWIFAWFAKL